MEKNVRRQESKHALKKHSFKNSIERKQNSTKKWAKRAGPCRGMQRRQYWARALKDLHNRELTRFTEPTEEIEGAQSDMLQADDISQPSEPQPDRYQLQDT
jgi:hypothetical protein